MQPPPVSVSLFTKKDERDKEEDHEMGVNGAAGLRSDVIRAREGSVDNIEYRTLYHEL